MKIDIKKLNFVIYGVIVTYSSSFWIQTNSLPFILSSLNNSTQIYGYMETLFGSLQLIGSPLFGRFGDLYGCKMAMMASLISCVLSYSMLSISTSLLMLVVSRIPIIFMHTMQAGQMIVTDCNNVGDRSRILGGLGFSYGIGMVLGNLLGGLVTTNIGPRFSPVLSSTFCSMALISVYFFVPDISKKPIEKYQKTDDRANTAIVNWRLFYQLISTRTVAYLFLLKILTGMPLGILQGTFPIISVQYFHSTAQTNGLIMGYIGAVSMIMQGLGVTILTKYLSDSQLIYISFPVLIIGYLVLSKAVTLWLLLVALAPLVVGQSLLGTAGNSLMTHAVSPDRTGAVLGLSMALNSLIRTLGPGLGMWLLTPEHGYSNLGLLSSILISGVAVVSYAFSHHAIFPASKSSITPEKSE